MVVVGDPRSPGGEDLPRSGQGRTLVRARLPAVAPGAFGRCCRVSVTGVQRSAAGGDANPRSAALPAGAGENCSGAGTVAATLSLGWAACPRRSPQPGPGAGRSLPAQSCLPLLAAESQGEGGSFGAPVARPITLGLIVRREVCVWGG